MYDREKRIMIFKNGDERETWIKKCDEQAMREYSKESEKIYEKWRKDGEFFLEEFINNGGQEIIDWLQGMLDTCLFLNHWEYERRYGVAYEFIESMLQKCLSCMKQPDCCTTMLQMMLGSLRSEIEANEIDPYEHEYEYE